MNKKYDVMIEKIVNICEKILDIEVKWDYASFHKKENHISAKFLKPDEVQKVIEDWKIEDGCMIFLNENYIKNNPDDEIIIYSSIAHESMHQYQWEHRFENETWEKEFNDNFKMSASTEKDYLSRSLEVYAYVFQNEFIRFLTNNNGLKLACYDKLPKTERIKAENFVRKLFKNLF